MAKTTRTVVSKMYITCMDYNVSINNYMHTSNATVDILLALKQRILLAQKYGIGTMQKVITIYVMCMNVHVNGL